MKKLMTIVAIALTVATGLSEARAAGERTWEWSPLGLGIAAPIQLPFTETDVYGIRLGGLFGSNADVCGLDVSLAALERGQMVGVQVAGFTWAVQDVYGLQVGAVANVVRENVVGVQLGLVNADFGELNDGLAVGAVNYSLAYDGVQVAALNWNATVSAGVQVGVGNYAAEEYAGGAVGAVNLAGAMTGCQLGAVNCANDVTGCQIGFVNATERLHGVQIGALNLVTESVLPIMVVVNASF